MSKDKENQIDAMVEQIQQSIKEHKKTTCTKLEAVRALLTKDLQIVLKKTA